MRNHRQLACHVHTEWSFDGTWSIHRLARTLRLLGYDGMLTAEHVQTLDESSWRAYRDACAAASSPDFLVVPGVEYRDATNTVHVPVWGDVPLLDDGSPVSDLLADVARANGAAVLAHPGRRAAIEQYDPAWSGLVSGVEVWNRKYDGWAPNPAALDLVRKWDVPAFVSLDFHTRRQLFPLAMSVPGRGPLAEAEVLEALRRGRLRPTFLRRPVEQWTGRTGLPVLRRLEAARRRVAPYSHRRTSRTGS